MALLKDVTMTGKDIRDELLKSQSPPRVLAALQSNISRKNYDVFVDVVETLKRAGVRISEHEVALENETKTKSVRLPLLHWAAIFNRKAEINYLLAECNCTSVDRDSVRGGTALHSFLLYRIGQRKDVGDESSTLDRILPLFVDAFYECDNDSLTPLLLSAHIVASEAVFSRIFWEDAVRAFIVQARIDLRMREMLDACDGDGNTALHVVAPWSVLRSFVHTLVTNGASLEARNVDGLTPGDLALKSHEGQSNASLLGKTPAISLPSRREEEERTYDKSKLDSSSANKRKSSPRKRRDERSKETPPPKIKKKKESSVLLAAKISDRSRLIVGLPSDWSQDLEPRSRSDTPEKSKQKTSSGPSRSNAASFHQPTDDKTNIIASCIEAGLLSDMTEAAKDTKQRLVGTVLPSLYQKVDDCESDLKKARSEMSIYLNAFVSMTKEIQNLTESLEKLREAEAACLLKQTEAEKKVSEVMAKIRHCDKIIDEIPYLDQAES